MTTPPTSGNRDKGSKSNSKKVAVIAIVAVVAIIIGVVLLNSHQGSSQPPVSNEQPTEDYMPVDTTSASYEDVSTVNEETTTTEADAEEDKAANVKATIKKLYTYAATHSEAQTSRKCLSEDFADCLQMLRDHDRKYHSGEVGLIDYDIWTRAQDDVIGFGVRVNDVEFRKDYNDNEYADATVTLTSSGKPYNKVSVTMLNEEGDRGWVIDDVNGLKADIKTYIATD